jgi:DNA-binding transcriptional regulator YiaG
VYNLILMRERKRRQWDRKRVRALRQHLGLTQTKLAEELGTRQQTISEWEIGMYQPRGTSATLLNIIAERSGFDYKAKEKHYEH